jgi:hypothetical protein
MSSSYLNFNAPKLVSEKKRRRECGLGSETILLIVTQIICGRTYLSFIKAPPGWAIRRAGLPSLSAIKFTQVVVVLIG